MEGPTLLMLLVVVPWLVLGTLTALGSRERGDPFAVQVASGLWFPLTWIQWYVRDVLLARANPPATLRGTRRQFGHHRRSDPAA